VYANTRRAEVQAWGWSGDQVAKFVAMQFEARRRGYKAAYPTAAEEILLFDETPVGSMLVERSASEIRLIDIALLNEHQNRGIGSGLINDLIAEANAADLPLRLSVLRGNPAKRLYERLGFVAGGFDGMYFEMEHRPGDGTSR